MKKFTTYDGRRTTTTDAKWCTFKFDFWDNKWKWILNQSLIFNFKLKIKIRRNFLIFNLCENIEKCLFRKYSQSIPVVVFILDTTCNCSVVSSINKTDYHDITQILLKAAKVPGENHRPVASCIEYISPWTGLKLMLVVIGTDCTGSCKSIYHTVTTMMAPIWYMYYKQDVKINKQE